MGDVAVAMSESEIVFGQSDEGMSVCLLFHGLF